MTNKKIITYNNERLHQMAHVGMKSVDPRDIRPPQILLIQSNTNTREMVTPAGKFPFAGQYFHTGKLEIHDEFECYFIHAAKGTYIDKRKPEAGVKNQYQVIGVMDDMSIFGILFRSTSYWTLSKLFSISVSQNRPMFSMRVKMEKKELENSQGKWFIPVCRIMGVEADSSKLSQLEEIALRFDSMATTSIPEEDNDEPKKIEADIESSLPTQEGVKEDVIVEADTEQVNPKDIPF